MRRFAGSYRSASMLACVMCTALQVQASPVPLDPSRQASLKRPRANRLREQFIWTRGDAAALDPALQSSVRGQDQKISPHFFRTVFHLASVPAHATLYLAGPRSATVFVNGIQVLRFGDSGKAEKGFHVQTADVAAALRRGQNTIALEEVRGHSSLHTGASPTINQLTYGEVLLVKIVPRSLGVFATPVLASNGSWRSTLEPAKDWSEPNFEDRGWATVQVLGVPGSTSDFLQWNADAGLYAWPGYEGVSAAMRTFCLPVAKVIQNENSSRILNAGTLERDGTLQVLSGDEGGPQPALMLDFGREISGRVHLVSASDSLVQVEASYGESAEEAAAHPYLGTRTLNVPAHGEIYGPKSGFRYIRLTFPAGPSAWKRIDVEGITYPVLYKGAFQSSDALLNRIWDTGAYTAHLCMQEGIWDAPKRDRGRWMGDLDVTGRVITSVFADRKLMEETMTQVIGDPPVTREVNTIAGYSALWITGQADFYRHLGDLAYLKQMHVRLLDLLRVMDRDLNEAGLFNNPAKHKVFVDWSSGFSADTPEARAATQFEFVAGYREAIYLLTELGDTVQAEHCQRMLERLRESAQASLITPETDTFGSRWQTNAMAVVSGTSTSVENAAIWDHVLGHVNDVSSTAVVTPYYGYYVLSAMALLNHRADALAWMRRYWGGMLDEGATSFWEAYDLHWPRADFHASLEADNKKGYYVSLSHGWSSGPTAWLIEQILGIQPVSRGFQSVVIRPDLAGLAWARGAVPTPRGLIRIDISAEHVSLSLPPGTRATVLLPFAPGAGAILDNGRPLHGVSTEEGSRTQVEIAKPGLHHLILRRKEEA